MAKKKTKKRMIKGSERNNVIDGPHKFFNIRKVANITKIDADKLYNNFKGKYKSLQPEECKQIATCLMIPVAQVFQQLGMKVNFSAIVGEVEPIIVPERLEDFDNLPKNGSH